MPVLTAYLANYSGNDTSGFSFAIEYNSLAKISSQSKNGVVYVKGISSGSTKLTISHTATTVTKEVLVVVGKTAAEIEEILTQTVLFHDEKECHFLRLNRAFGRSERYGGKSKFFEILRNNLNEFR